MEYADQFVICAGRDALILRCPDGTRCDVGMFVGEFNKDKAKEIRDWLNAHVDAVRPKALGDIISAGDALASAAMTFGPVPYGVIKAVEKYLKARESSEKTPDAYPPIFTGLGRDAFIGAANDAPKDSHGFYTACQEIHEAINAPSDPNATRQAEPDQPATKAVPSVMLGKDYAENLITERGRFAREANKLRDEVAKLQADNARLTAIVDALLSKTPSQLQ